MDTRPIPPFERTLARHGVAALHAASVSTLQVNVGKRCNQACKHCHVDAGPLRTEMMAEETVEQVLDAVRRFRIPTVDITGGAPELNPHFERLVAGSREAGAHVMVRHNFTVQFEPGKQGLPDFFREQDVEVIASLPCYLAENVDAQRGRGVFGRSIEAMRRLNEVGYGRPGTGLLLNLVYNPLGAELPPPQEELQEEYRRELRARYGLVFNRLYTLTNMPIRRFLDHLRRTGDYARYMETLAAAFNPATVEGLMCRSLISVGWDGRLYDCDFNQMLDLPLTPGMPRHIRHLDPAVLANRRIATADHCYGCTAGAGSSCGGVVV